MFWVSVGLLSLSVMGLILYPLVRRHVGTASRSEHIVGIYHEQLDELDRDLARGLLTEKQATVTKAEIAHRIAEAADPAEGLPSGVGTIRQVLIAAAVVLGLPAGSLFLYLYMGMPGQPDRPLAQRTEELQFADHAQRLDEYSKILAVRLEENPHDAEGWATLGRLHRTFGRFTESADAFARLHALRPEAATAATDHAEALVHVSQGVVSKTAESMFAAALAIDPKNVKARFYMGSALAGRPDGIPKAIEIWSSLERESPPDAPWLDALRQNIRVARADLAALTEAGRAADPSPAKAGTGTVE